jgi:hypothetical protein
MENKEAARDDEWDGLLLESRLKESRDRKILWAHSVRLIQCCNM